MELLKSILLERAQAHLADSKVIQVISKNLKLTDKKGGPVRVVTSSRNQVVLNLGEGEDRIQATFITGNKWKITTSNGLGKTSKKTISDEEFVSIAEKIFAKAKKFKK